MIYGLLLFYVLSITQARETTEIFQPETISKYNYGFHMLPQRSIRPVTDRWTHVFHISLPTLHGFQTLQLTPPPVCPQHETEDNCIHLFRFHAAIQEVEVKSFQLLNDTYNEFRQLLQVTVPDTQTIRSRRGFLDFVGEGMSLLFGTTSHSELNRVYDVIREVRKTQFEGFQTLANVTHKLASFMKITTDNFRTVYNVFEGYNKLVDTLRRDQYLQRYILGVLESHLVFAMRQSVEFTMELNAITQLRLALLSTLQGRLDPHLIPPELIQTTIDNIRARLITMRTPLYLVPTSLHHVFSGHDHTLSRDDNRLYIAIHFAISPVPTSLTYYKILTHPIPFTPDSDHVTQLTGLPPYVAYNPDIELFLSFPDPPNFETQQATLSLQHTPHVFHHRNSRSCISVLLSDNLELIPQVCPFAVQPNGAVPQIFPLQQGHLILLNISSYTLHCTNGSSRTIHPPQDGPNSRSVRLHSRQRRRQIFQ
jgi:hypothetical protein